MGLLSKDQILKADDLKTVDIPVPEWADGEATDVRLRTLTGEERDQFEADSVTFNKKGEAKQNFANTRARLVAMVLINEDGTPQFSAYDIPDLGRKSAVALDRVFMKAQDMNGFTPEDLEKLAEGFEPGPSEDSTTD